MIEREPITVILSQRGWIRAMKGHADLASADTAKFKEGDGPLFAFHAQTTDKLLLAADTGRFYTLAADKLPGGRGFGEPVRLMIDLDGDAGIVALFPARSADRLLVVASDGRGFVVKAADTVAETRKGKTVVYAACGREAEASSARSPRRMITSRRSATTARCWCFPLSEMAELARGQGVQVAAISRRRPVRRRRPSDSPTG